MKKLNLLWMLVFLVTGMTFGQQAVENAPAETLEKSLLWEISGNDLEQPSYLYGTIHLITKDAFFLTEPTKKAMAEADQFTFEIDMAEMSDMSAMMPLLMQAFMKGDTTLSDLLTAEEYKVVNDHFSSKGLPLMMLERIKPMFLSVLAGGDDMMAPGGGLGEGMMSYEMEIAKEAEKNKKPTAGLETAAFQMSIFDAIPYKAQAQMLLEAIKVGDDDESEGQFDQMIETYKQQDIEAMVSMMDEEGGISGYEDILLVDRNKKWIPIMEEMMKEKKVFFAVGAGHLGGEYGVIRLLRKQGYTLKPLY